MAVIKVATGAPPPKLLEWSMIYIYVGEDSVPLIVHRNIALLSSDFLKHALEGGFMEAANGIVHLRDQRKELVEVYVGWLYFSKVAQPESRSMLLVDRFRQLYDLFVLADMLQDERFGNAIMDTMLQETEAAHEWPISLATSAWTDLPDASPMRKYLLDLWVTRSNITWFNEHTGDVANAPQAFWVEVAKLSTINRDKKVIKPPKPAPASRCRYHCHRDGKLCC